MAGQAQCIAACDALVSASSICRNAAATRGQEHQQHGMKSTFQTLFPRFSLCSKALRYSQLMFIQLSLEHAVVGVIRPSPCLPSSILQSSYLFFGSTVSYQ